MSLKEDNLALLKSLISKLEGIQVNLKNVKVQNSKVIELK